MATARLSSTVVTHAADVEHEAADDHQHGHDAGPEQPAELGAFGRVGASVADPEERHGGDDRAEREGLRRAEQRGARPRRRAGGRSSRSRRRGGRRRDDAVGSEHQHQGQQVRRDQHDDGDRPPAALEQPTRRVEEQQGHHSRQQHRAEAPHEPEGRVGQRQVVGVAVGGPRRDGRRRRPRPAREPRPPGRRCRPAGGGGRTPRPGAAARPRVPVEGRARSPRRCAPRRWWPGPATARRPRATRAVDDQRGRDRPTYPRRGERPSGRRAGHASSITAAASRCRGTTVPSWRDRTRVPRRDRAP